MSSDEIKVIQQTAVLAGLLAPFMGPRAASMYAMELANNRLIDEPVSELVHALTGTTDLNAVEIIHIVRNYRAVMHGFSHVAFITEEPTSLTAPRMSILDIAAPSLN